MEEIRNTINKFANSFDIKDWDGLKSVLSNEIMCDYSDLRGEKDLMHANDFISKRIKALNHLETHHMFSNFQIRVNRKEAKCIVSAIIWRRSNDAKFITHAIYTFGLIYKGNSWLISDIKQKVLWNKGDPSIHSGFKK